MNIWKKFLAYWCPEKRIDPRLRIEDLDEAWANRFCEMWKDRPCDLGYLERKGRLSVKYCEPYEAEAKAAMKKSNYGLVAFVQQVNPYYQQQARKYLDSEGRATAKPGEPEPTKEETK